MYLFQCNHVDKLLELNKDTESQIATYQMRVQQAQSIERELLQIEEQSMMLRQDCQSDQQMYDMKREQFSEVLDRVKEMKAEVERKSREKTNQISDYECQLDQAQIEL